MGIQDLVNDMHNIAVETFERAIPWFLFDPMILDPVQMRQHALLPGEGVPARPGVGQQLANSIWKAPTASMDSQIAQWVAGLRETGREITVLPAILAEKDPARRPVKGCGATRRWLPGCHLGGDARLLGQGL